jgi:hypothetical protein
MGTLETKHLGAVPVSDSTFRYVRHDDVECYLHVGWEIAADFSAGGVKARE